MPQACPSRVPVTDRVASLLVHSQHAGDRRTAPASTAAATLKLQHGLVVSNQGHVEATCPVLTVCDPRTVQRQTTATGTCHTGSLGYERMFADWLALDRLHLRDLR